MGEGACTYVSMLCFILWSALWRVIECEEECVSITLLSPAGRWKGLGLNPTRVNSVEVSIVYLTMLSL